MMIARLSFFRRIKERGWSDVLLVSTVHDSIVVDCPTARIEEVAKLFHEVFNDLPKNFQKLFNVKMPIPFPCETKFGHNLGEMEKLNSINIQVIDVQEDKGTTRNGKPYALLNITYKNQGKSERTPIMFERKASSKKNVNLLKVQGATSIRVHWVKE